MQELVVMLFLTGNKGSENIIRSNVRITQALPPFNFK